MRAIVAALLLQALTVPDPAQMEKAPDLGFKPVPHVFTLPAGLSWGAPAGIATTSKGHIIIFNRGPYPLLEFDRDGKFIRSFGEGRYMRPHGLRLDAADNIWTTDVIAHTVTKMSPKGEVLLVLGVKEKGGDWNEATGSRLLNEPTDLAFGPGGEVFVTQGHGKAEARILRFTKDGKFIKSWGSNGKGPGQFDIAHSIVVDAKGLVYAADRQNRRVQIFDADGKYIKEWTYLGLPCGLYIAPDRQMYLTSGFAGQILRLDANGKAVGATGEAGKGLGQFGEAHYMTMGPEGNIYVADTVNATLQQFVKK